MHPLPPTPEIPVPRMGEYLVQQGYIRTEALIQFSLAQRDEMSLPTTP